MASPTTYQKARLSLAMLGLNGLPLDEYLSHLPPLPDTPKNARRIDDIPDGIVPKSVSQYTTPAPEVNKPNNGLLHPSDGQAPSFKVPGSVRRARSPLAKEVTSAEEPIDAGETRPEAQGDTLDRSTSQQLSPLAPAQALPSNPPALNREPANPSPAPAPRLSASFRLPNMGDLSLIGDCSLFGGGGVDDDSLLDFEMSRIGPQGRDIPTSDPSSVSELRQGNRLQAPSAHLAQSTIFPSSPAHLLASTNALDRVDPPWKGNESTMTTVSSDDSSDTLNLNSRPSSPTKGSSAKTPSLPRSRGTPSSQFSSSLQSKSKRTFPASSSGNSLAAVGEEAEYRPELEQSTLLPFGLHNAAYPLRDEDLLSRETMVQDKSYRLGNLPTRQMSMPKGNLGDMTMDVKALMANVGKPKRASGTEESFVDLLNAEDEDMIGRMDMTMLGADETMMLPAELRPHVATRQAPLSRGLPTAQTSRGLAHLANEDPLSDAPSTLTRSKSLSKVAEIIQRVKADKAASALARPTTPPKTVSSARTYKSSVDSAVTPAVHRARTNVAPHTTGSRRISRSAGAMPMPESASQTTITLPSTRAPAHARTQSAAIPGSVRRMPTSASSSSLSSRTTGRNLGVTEARNARGKETPSSTITARVPRESIMPAQKPRVGSTTSSVSTVASGARAPASTRSAVTPASTRSLPRSATTSSLSSTGLPTTRAPRARASVAPAGLPRPGTGSSARSAVASGVAATTPAPRTRTSRAFGNDATATTNRATTTSDAPATVARSKLSTKPSSSAGAPTGATSASERLKARALSTPASAIARQTTLPSSRAAPSVEARKSTRPLVSASGEPPRPRVGSTLPRAPTSRVPAVGGKSSAPPTSSSSSSLASKSGGNLAGLRSRLDELQAKQQARSKRLAKAE
ncbi:hypothetical protein B9479_001842 [Cryptococcus floricola]|uniref:Uncharacterized protein n=1 Tax=Cryptococcus floricola TaxID=2591691 RepID=A0A5D3B3V2_9TREE|nr:hypothetical protein B9479_001842 [Cryptococcus floricola]